MRLGSLAVVVALLVGPQADGKETVTWEAVALSGPGRTVLDKGTKSYLPSHDIIVRKGGPDNNGRPGWDKSLPLSDTFAVGASVHQEKKLDGFGLVVYRRGDRRGFSWEWFQRESGSTFRKLQGEGRLSVSIKKAGDYEELEAVEFLDDIVLRYLDDMAKGPGRYTHEILIKKGSVLRVAP
jgi:hypothetical protein